MTTRRWGAWRFDSNRGVLEHGSYRVNLDSVYGCWDADTVLAFIVCLPRHHDPANFIRALDYLLDLQRRRGGSVLA